MRQGRSRMAAMETAEVVEALVANDVPCAPVLGLEEVASHPQVVANEVLHTVDHPVLGRLIQPGPIPPIGGTRAGGRWPAPSVGEHSDEVLRDLGYGDGDIEELRRRGCVVGARPVER